MASVVLEEILVIAIAVLAGGWLLRRWIVGARKSSACGGCDGCCGCGSKKEAK